MRISQQQTLAILHVPDQENKAHYVITHIRSETVYRKNHLTDTSSKKTSTN